MNKGVRDRVALVTGAGSPIGRAITEKLLAEGATVYLADKVDFEVAPGARAQKQIADLGDFATAAAVVQACVDAFGRIDILVNNAGGGVIRPFLEHDAESLEETLRRNLWTCLGCCHAALPHMVRANYGRIVSIGAESVRNGLMDHAGYNAAKGGVHALATGLAREFALQDITVNVIAPSGVATPRAKQLAAEGHPLMRAAVSAIPKGRLAEVEEIADAVHFLASAEAGFITGQVISVNGGSSML